jgi:sugar lactone lactonase YvrE
MSRSNLTCVAFATILAVTALTCAPTLLDASVIEKVYWSDFDGAGIFSIDPDGTNKQTLVSGSDAGGTGTRGLWIEETTDKLYWNTYYDDTANPAGEIARADLDGSNVESSFVTPSNPYISGTDGARGIAFDSASDHIYWTETYGDQIQRAKLSDGSAETQFANAAATGDGSQTAVFHPTNKYLYWYDLDTRKVRRADTTAALPHTGSQTVVDLTSFSFGTGSAVDMALDSAGNDLYISLYDDHTIVRVDLDGTPSASKFLDATNDGIDTPRGLTVSPLDGRLYFGEDRTGAASDVIRYADLGTGSNLGTLLNIGSGRIDGLEMTFIPEPAALMLLLSGGLALLLHRRRR